MSQEIYKHFPAGIKEQNRIAKQLTFLEDKKLDGRLYALLLEKSYGLQGKTIVKKRDLPAVKDIMEICGCSKQTYYNHLSELKKKGYIKDYKLGNDECYEIPRVEDFFFSMPVETIEYILHTMKKDIIKGYVYLGQKFQTSNQDFTLESFGDHADIKNIKVTKEARIRAWNYLRLLQTEGLVDICQYWDKKKIPHLKVCGVCTDINQVQRKRRVWKQQNGNYIIANPDIDDGDELPSA